jgi:uncharacterized protein (TIGR00255 family)
MNSMTGFGRSNISGKDFDISIEISTVNRKSLEINVTLPREWAIFEKDVTELAKQQVFRGKIYINVTVKSTREASKTGWNDDAVNDTIEQLKALAKKMAIEFKPDADFLLRVVQMTSQADALPVDEEILDDLINASGKALEGLLSMRAAEGKLLQDDLDKRIDMIAGYLRDLKPFTLNTAQRHKDLLLDRLKQSGLDLDLNDERVLREISIFADRCDVSEEFTRLDSHIAQFKDSIREDGLVGRKLDFLCQELNREINTIGSKANNIEVTKIVIEMKNELERIREQVQNVE